MIFVIKISWHNNNNFLYFQIIEKCSKLWTFYPNIGIIIYVFNFNQWGSTHLFDKSLAKPFSGNPRAAAVEYLVMYFYCVR